MVIKIKIVIEILNVHARGDCIFIWIKENGGKQRKFFFFRAEMLTFNIFNICLLSSLSAFNISKYDS